MTCVCRPLLHTAGPSAIAGVKKSVSSTRASEQMDNRKRDRPARTTLRRITDGLLAHDCKTGPSAIAGVKKSVSSTWASEQMDNRKRDRPARTTLRRITDGLLAHDCKTGHSAIAVVKKNVSSSAQKKGRHTVAWQASMDH